MTDKKRNNHITFRLSDSEYQPLKEIMEGLGLTRSDFFRLLVTSQLDETILERKNKSDYNRLLFLYNKTSNNINQIAKNLNILFLSGDITEDNLKRWLNVLNKVSNNMQAGIDYAG